LRFKGTFDILAAIAQIVFGLFLSQKDRFLVDYSEVSGCFRGLKECLILKCYIFCWSFFDAKKTKTQSKVYFWLFFCALLTGNEMKVYTCFLLYKHACSFKYGML